MRTSPRPHQREDVVIKSLAFALLQLPHLPVFHPKHDLSSISVKNETQIQTGRELRSTFIFHPQQIRAGPKLRSDAAAERNFSSVFPAFINLTDSLSDRVNKPKGSRQESGNGRKVSKPGRAARQKRSSSGPWRMVSRHRRARSGFSLASVTL